MATLTTDNIGEVIIPVIRQVIREEVPPIVREIVHQETEERFEAIGQDLQHINEVLYEHGQELYRLGVLFEDLDDRFRADSELLRENLNVSAQVKDHEIRLEKVESTQRILKEAVTDHSRQLKAA